MPTHKIIDYLKQLELTDEEATIYLTLLQTGPVSVKSLAGETDIKRTTAYLYINSLIEKGLIAKIVKGSQKMVAANDPHDSLEYLMTKKIEKAQAIKANFPQMLETITTSLPSLKDVSDAEVRYYKGINGVTKIYEEALKTQEIRSYVNTEEIAKAFPNNYQLLNIAYKKNPELKLFEICEDSPITKERLKLAHKNHFYKILPKKMKLTSQDVLIYDNKIAIIDLKGATSGVVLHSFDLSNNFKLLFNLLWDILPINSSTNL